MHEFFNNGHLSGIYAYCKKSKYENIWLLSVIPLYYLLATMCQVKL